MNAVYEKGSYLLIDDNGKTVGNLTSYGFFSPRSVIQTGEDQYELSQSGLFSAIKITRNGIDVGKIKSGWGSIRITMENESRIKIFVVSRKGIWKTRFVLSDERKNVLAMFVPRFRWKTMHYDFMIEPDRVHSARISPALLLFGIYGAKKLRSQDSGSAAG